MDETGAEGVGGLIRRWRTRRRMSQQDLADEAEVSARHLSWLETGRARPSREMVLVLASALEVPLRERNTLLQAAGFAAAYRETDLGAPEMAQVRAALTHLLRGAEPFGCIVMDRVGNLVLANGPWRRQSELLLGRPIRDGENIVRLTLAADGFRPWIANFDEVAEALILRAHRQLLTEADAELAALFAEVTSLPGIPDGWRTEAGFRAPPLAIPLRLRVGDRELNLFTTLTTLGTPTDVTLSELVIEHYFPADAATEAFARAL